MERDETPARSREQILAEAATQLRGHLTFEQGMGSHGIPSVVGEGRLSELPQAGDSRPPAGPYSADPEVPVALGGDRMTTAGAQEGLAGPHGLPLAERERRLATLAQEAAECRACVLHERRNRNVFARGNPASDIAFVGEGPGRDEDRKGLPFVGAAGQLLDKMVAAMGYARDDVYICNVVKCRPPENRTPRAEEALACAKFLRSQLEIVAPTVIVALGRCAAEHLGVAGPEGPWRGRWGSFQGIEVMPTYHPAFLLRSPQFKRVVWQDLQKVMAKLSGDQPRGSAST